MGKGALDVGKEKTLIIATNVQTDIYGRTTTAIKMHSFYNHISLAGEEPAQSAELLTFGQISINAYHAHLNLDTALGNILVAMT